MTYTERLRPPFLWWVVFGLVGVTFVIAVAVFFDTWFVLATLGVVLAIEVVTMLAFTGSVEVTEKGVAAGRALLEWPYVGTVTVLSKDEVRIRMGRDADPRAFLAYRSYVEEAVEIAVSDEADPHPYWLVSTRDAAALAAAIEKARVAA